jgi:hypothetical protein
MYETGRVSVEVALRKRLPYPLDYGKYGVLLRLGHACLANGSDRSVAFISTVGLKSGAVKTSANLNFSGSAIVGA